MILPVIVINAFSRPESFRRLLDSLSQAEVPQGARLVISLESGSHADVVHLAKEFTWSRGEKEVLEQNEKLGLINHFHFCGALTKKFGPIIYLEDDLFVGKGFYSYAQQVLQAYHSDEEIAGFSLNSLWFNGYLHFPFIPIDDGNPCFFLQVPWYQGQIYTPEQWLRYEKWLEKEKTPAANLQIHPMFRDYKFSDDWFPIKIRYLIETNSYYCFPRTSYCVNFGDAGTHFSKKTDFFQTELSLGSPSLTFKSFQSAQAVYDSFYELLPEKLQELAPRFKSYDFEMDLNGSKDLSQIRKPYVITSLKPGDYAMSFGLEMRPPELNLIYDIAGRDIFLTSPDRIRADGNKNKQFERRFRYHYRFKASKLGLIRLLMSRIFKSW